MVRIFGQNEQQSETGPSTLRPMAIRVFDIDGGINFRDLGGYAIPGGQSLAWKRLYRSGHFSDVTVPGWQSMGELGIRTVIDFREPFERVALPTVWGCEPQPELLSQGHAAGASFDNADLLAWDDDLDLGRARERRIRSYANKPLEYAPAMRRLFHTLADESAYPLVMHCVGGKDRTGFAAAIVLDWLGVPREQIVEDYMLSAKSVSRITPERVRRIIEMYGLQQSNPDSLKAITEVRPEYLQAALARVDRLGGAAEYLRETVGVSSLQLDQAKQLLVAP